MTIRTEASIASLSPVQSAIAAWERFTDRDDFLNPETLCRLLGRAQIKGWIRYPNEHDTPASLMRRGMALQRAMEEGDKDTVDRLGAQYHKIRYQQRKARAKAAS